MNKALLTKQLDQIKNLPPGETCDFSEEGAGVLHTFVTARAKVPNLNQTELALHQKIKRLLSHWENTCKITTSAPANAPDQRTQLVLRAAIDKVLQDDFSSLSLDDAALLRGTYASLSARSSSESNNRLQSLLVKVIQRLDEVQPESAGTSTIFDDDDLVAEKSQGIVYTNQINTETDFGDISKTPYKILEGIEVNINVRKFEYEGNTLIAGDVPKDVLIKITGGSLQINGFVTGNVIADEDIHIDGNIQGGIAISLKGSIRLDRCLMGTRLIALKGKIYCTHLEAPETAFAWDTLQVDGAVLSGQVFGGKIEVNGKAVSTDFYSSGQINVSRVETGTRGPCGIFLNSLLTCEDYGRFMDKSFEEKQTRVSELVQQTLLAEQLDRYTHTMIHNSYRTALFYLLGGVDNANSAMDLQGMQMKMAYFEQIVALSESITGYIRNELEIGETINVENFHDFMGETQDTFKLILSDIESLPEEFGSTHKRYLLDRCHEYEAFTRNICDTHDQDNIKTKVMTVFTKTLSSWRGTLGDSKRDIQALIQQFELPEETLHKIEHAPESLDEMLDETVDMIFKKNDFQQVQRAKSPLIRLLRQSADRYARNIETNHTKILQYRKEIKELKEQLYDESVVLYGDASTGSCSFTASFCEDGTVISSSRSQRTGRDTNLAKTIVLEHTVEEEVEFERLDNLVQRKTA
jgi:hypothetical protein